MTDEMDDASNSGSGAPVDFDRLDVSEERWSADERFTRINSQPAFAPERLVCVYDQRFYPASVQVARLGIVWFENGDFRCTITRSTMTGRSIIGGTGTRLAITPVITSIQAQMHRLLARTRLIRRIGVTFSHGSLMRSKIDNVRSGTDSRGSDSGRAWGRAAALAQGSGGETIQSVTAVTDGSIV